METASYEARPSRYFTVAVWSLIAIPLFPEYLAPVLAVLSLILTAVDCRRSGTPLRVGTVFPFITLYIIYTAIGALYSAHPLSCLAIAAMWLVMACGYLSLVNLLSSPARLHAFLHLLTLTVGAMGLIACVEYGVNLLVSNVLPLQFWDPLDEIVYRLSPVAIRLKSEGVRVAATFSNPNVFAEGMVMLLPFSLFSVTTDTDRKQRILHIVCLILGIVGTLFSFSRGAFFALIAMAVIFIALNFGHLLHNRKLLAGVLVGILLILVFLLLIPNPISTRLETLDADDISIQQRLQYWSAGADIFWVTHPQVWYEWLTDLNLGHALFGIGAGTGNSTALLLDAGIAGAPHLHNLFLQLLVEGGLISLGLILALIGRTVYLQWKVRRQNSEAYLFSGAMFTMLCGSMLFGLVDFLFLCPKLVGIFLLCIALSDAACHCYKAQELVLLPKGLICFC